LQIVCKFFIDAIETQKFGWFWECPNGQGCQYRHALPPGFVLRSQKKAAEDAAKANQISLEEFLEVEVRRRSCKPFGGRINHSSNSAINLDRI